MLCADSEVGGLTGGAPDSQDAAALLVEGDGVGGNTVPNYLDCVADNGDGGSDDEDGDNMLTCAAVSISFSHCRDHETQHNTHPPLRQTARILRAAAITS